MDFYTRLGFTETFRVPVLLGRLLIAWTDDPDGHPVQIVQNLPSADRADAETGWLAAGGRRRFSVVIVRRDRRQLDVMAKMCTAELVPRRTLATSWFVGAAPLSSSAISGVANR